MFCLVIMLSAQMVTNYYAYPTLILLFLYVTFQPPWDTETFNKYIIHYTYGCDYNLKVHYFSQSLNGKIMVFE